MREYVRGMIEKERKGVVKTERKEARGWKKAKEGGTGISSDDKRG